MEPNPATDDLAFAHHLADLAAQLTMSKFGGRIPVELKSDSSPVTEMDAAVERMIRAEIIATFPDDGMLGEEEGLHEGANARVWVVDPIDGTKMFAEGIPLWTTLIGLRSDGAVTAAVADAPALGERYHAVLNRGAYCGNERIQVSDVANLADALVLHASLEEFSRGTGLAPLSRLAQLARGTRGIGDAWAHLLVARGAADALVEQGPCFEWDWAATSLIVGEAGGQLSQLDGSAPAAGCHLLVSNGQFDQSIRAALLG